MVVNWIKQNHRAISFIIAAAGPVEIGIYINIYTRFVSSPTNKGLLSLVVECGWWNCLLPAFILTLFLQFYISYLPEAEFEKAKARLVYRILGAACRSIVYPKTLESTQIRAIVSLINKSTGRRVTRYSFNADPDPERQGEWPIDFGVTGEAITGKQVVLRELTPTHYTNYAPEVRLAVHHDVKTILAAPILDPANPRGQPLGVVAFDSILSISEIGFGSREIRNVAQSWADVLSILLTRRDFTEEVP